MAFADLSTYEEAVPVKFTGYFTDGTQPDRFWLLVRVCECEIQRIR